MINFDGSPYNYVEEKVLVCHQGKDKNKRAKEKYKAGKEAEKVEELNIYISCFSIKWYKKADIRIRGQSIYIGGGCVFYMMYTFCIFYLDARSLLSTK